jgi:hypothetical protein
MRTIDMVLLGVLAVQTAVVLVLMAIVIGNYRRK